MKIVFVTRRQHDLAEPIEERYVTDDLGRRFSTNGEISNIELEVTDSLDSYHQMMTNADELGLDTENNNLNQFYATPLLLQLAVPGLTYVIDQTSVKEDYLSMYTDKLYIGHNLQYDYRIIKWCMGIELIRLKDTMINAQIINRGSGRFNNLEDEYFRRVGKKLPEDKTTRNDFIRMTNKSIYKRKHVIYSGFDPQACLEMLPIQEEILKRYRLEFRANEIAHPLIHILGDMNIEGGTLDKDTWRKILEENKKERFKVERELDTIISEFAKDHIKLRGGIWSSSSRTRKREEGVQTDLFGRDLPITTECKKNVSYSSSPQLTKLFTILKEPLPEKEDTKNRKGWDDAPIMKVSFDEPTLSQYLIEYPTSKMVPFINKLLEYKELEKEINSFGEIFLREYVRDGKGKKFKRGYYQPATDKIHTIYKQEFTKNGRLASGGDKKKKGDIGIGFFNSQQWPKKNKFRNCLTLTQEEINNGWYISTSDLGSAELIILASKSKDKNLKENIRKDLHSFLATHSYTRTIKYIVETMNENRAYDELYQLLKVNRIQKTYYLPTGKLLLDGKPEMRLPTSSEIDFITKQRVELAFNQKAIIINKKEHPDIRDPYKNCTYGVTYGAGEDKIAKTLNIAPFFAKLVMEGINIAIPDAMAYLRAVSNFGVKHGYIEFNERTHSRHWFQSWLEAQAYGRKLTGAQRSAIERFCKNAVMSGTQADMIKEGMVEIDKFVRKEKVPFKWLLQVHDEIVVKHKDKELRPVYEKILTDTCNLYLTGIEMEVAGHTGYSWHKE